MNYFNYFTEIEDTFIRRRGKHLLLSPMDWALIESWKQKGVPLHVALRGIEQAFDSFEARPRRRSVKSLLYCEEEVEAQYAEWRERQQGARASEPEKGASVAANGQNGAAGGDDERLATGPFGLLGEGMPKVAFVPIRQLHATPQAWLPAGKRGGSPDSKRA